MRPKAFILMLAVLLSVFACQQKEEVKAPPPPPPEVTVVVTETRDVPIFQEFVGQVFGLKDIAIRARVEGFLEGIHFKEGSHVEKGALLYTLESQPFEADVAAKMSGVAAAKTMLAKATSDLGRIKPLAERKAVSQSDLDAAIAQFEAAEASLEASEANLRASKIQLSYTRIHSPLSGIIGKTLAKEGDFVGRSPNPVILNTVSDIDTIRVQFFITESQYLQFMRTARKEMDKSVDEDREGKLELILADGSEYPFKGKADFLDRQIDPTTGSILIQASFQNPEGLIRPGQFARVRAEIAVVKEGILIPQRSVIELQGLYSVFVAGADNKIEKRNILVGPRVNGYWLITEGLNPGEQVVYEGLQRVREGVVVKPTVKETKTMDKENK